MKCINWTTRLSRKIALLKKRLERIQLVRKELDEKERIYKEEILTYTKLFQTKIKIDWNPVPIHI